MIYLLHLPNLQKPAQKMVTFDYLNNQKQKYKFIWIANIPTTHKIT